MAKHSINLLQAELLPETPLLTLPRVATLWLVTLAFMVSWSVMTNVQVAKLSAQASTLTRIKVEQDNHLANLENQLKANRNDPLLEEKLALYKNVLRNKKFLHKELTDPTHTSVAGFAAAMTELADLHHKDISLNQVNINDQDLTFSGIARSPDVVPAWLAKFESSVFLSGKAFIHFTLNENEQKLTEFMVSSKVSEAE